MQVKPKYQSHGLTATPQSTATREKVLGESIISVLVKLHDKMASPPTLYKPQAAQASSSTATGNPSTTGNAHCRTGRPLCTSYQLQRLGLVLLQVITVQQVMHIVEQVGPCLQVTSYPDLVLYCYR